MLPLMGTLLHVIRKQSAMRSLQSVCITWFDMARLSQEVEDYNVSDSNATP